MSDDMGTLYNTKTIRNLVNIMAAHEDQLFKAFEVDERRIREYCKKAHPYFIEILNKEKLETIEDLAELWYEYTGPSTHREDHYHLSRYRALNLHALFTRFHTVEIRYERAGKKRQDRKPEKTKLLKVSLQLQMLAFKARLHRS